MNPSYKNDRKESTKTKRGIYKISKKTLRRWRNEDEDNNIVLEDTDSNLGNP